MCTIIVLNDCVPGHPLVIGANRDERYDRASEPAKLRAHSVISPRDLEKGGTWIGASQGGWVVAVTNQDDGEHKDGMLSRGAIVDACLLARSHSGAAKVLSLVDPVSYNPFNVVFGRPGLMFLTRVLSGHSVEMEELPVGVSVISNDCWNDRYDVKIDWARRLTYNLTQDLSLDVNRTIAALMTVLASHHNPTPDDPFQAVCVHAEDHKFGTRSSSIITVSNEMDVEYFYSEGHPCMTTPLKMVGRLEHITC